MTLTYDVVVYNAGPVNPDGQKAMYNGPLCNLYRWAKKRRFMQYTDIK